MSKANALFPAMFLLTGLVAWIGPAGCGGTVNPEDIFDGLEDILANADPISTFDGEWLSPDFNYAMSVENRIGTVTLSNTTALQISDPIFVISSVDGIRLEGRHIFSDGSIVEVVGSRPTADTLTLFGGGFSWTLNRLVPNQAPIADLQSITSDADTPLTITLSGTDPDAGPDDLTFTVQTLPFNGQLAGTPPTLTYTPNPGFNGTDSFRYTASDGATTSAEATVVINVGGGNQPPTVNAGNNASIVFPTDFVDLNGTVTDDGLPDGTLTTTWSVLDGPQGATFTDRFAVDTTVTFALTGIYVLQLEATDGTLTSSATVTIFVRSVAP